MYGGGGYDDGGGGGGGGYDGGGYDGGGGGAGNANSLFGGGGFMPSQSTAVPESSGFSKGRSAQTLLPLTVKQIMDAAHASDDRSNFAIDGADVSTVRLVGRMLNKVERVTDVQFTLDDGTGKIDVKRWDNESSDGKEMADVNNGDYVIINGGLKGFQGKRHVFAYSVQRVTDFNDITHHFLHCIYVHLDHTKSKAQINASTATPAHTNQIRLSNNQAPTLSASGNAAGDDVSKLVLSVFHDPSVVNLEHGVHLKDFLARLNKLPEDVVKAVLQNHVDVGNIYNTIDDYHYKSALNG